MRFLLLASMVTAVLATGAPAWADTVTLTGKVSGMDGEPVKDVDVATMWLEGQPAGGVKTGADGTFELEARHYGRGLAVMVMDTKRENGAVAVVEADGLDDALNLTITPLVHVHGTFTCEELGEKPPWTNVYPTVLLIDPEGKLRRERGEGALRLELMKTDPAVEKHLKKLKRAGVGSFSRIAKSVAAKDDEPAAWALMLIAGDEKVRIAAVKALKKIEEPPEMLPWVLSRALQREEDKKVKELLEAWLEELKEEAEKEAAGN